jgi:UDP-glucose 4-epimerase
MMRSTYLVTGGAGFIGSHLCETLVGDGHAVRVLDDLSTGVRANLPPGVELIEGDIADATVMQAAVAGVDGCFHLAAIASVTRGAEDWLGTHRANLTGTITLFDEVRRLPRAVPVIYASSAAVYGDCADLPITERAVKRPLSAYGADKYACELHAVVASHVHSVPTVGLRFFNVYGPRQDPRSPYSGVISIFAERLRRGAPIDVFGDGGQTRDFIYVADVVAALRAAMAGCLPDAPQSTAPPLSAMNQVAAEAMVFNVCTGIAVSISELARTIAALTDMPAVIGHLPPRAGEIRHSVGSPELARQMLGLSNPTILRDGLRHVLDWLGASG